MAENKETIIKKIKNLLDLAGNNPNENEAVAAALKAQELMAKHHVELADVQGKDSLQKITEETYDINSKCHSASKWKYILSEIIEKNFCCKTYFIGSNSIVFYGHSKDAKIALEVFRFLFESGNRMAVRYYQKCRKQGKDTKGIINTYLTGFCDGIKEVLDRQCTALMLTVPEDVENSFEKYSKGFYEKKHKLATSNDTRAYKDGKEEGKYTALARGIN